MRRIDGARYRRHVRADFALYSVCAQISIDAVRPPRLQYGGEYFAFERTFNGFHL
jgi:hypothetical protein